jgi:hypothetical protein
MMILLAMAGTSRLSPPLRTGFAEMDASFKVVVESG